MGRPKMLSSERNALRVEEPSIGRQASQISRTGCRALHDETPVVQQQRAQTGKFFAAAGSSRTAVQATRNHVSVPGELRADAGIDDHDAAVQIADAKHNYLQKGRIIRKNRSDK